MSNLSELLPAGAGGKNVSFVASGTLPNGKPVILNANGTVTVVSESTISSSLGTAVAYNDDTGSCAIAYDSTNNKILIAYRNTSNDDGECIVGTVSGTSISFGSAAVFATNIQGDGNRQIGICFNSTESKFFIVYRDATINNSGRAITATISGTSVSFGSTAVFTTDVTNHQSCSYDSTSNKVIVIYRNSLQSNKGYAVVGTISGTSISFGTPVVFDSTSNYGINLVSIHDPNENKTVIVYGLTQGRAIVGTVSGTSISFGTAVVFSTAQTEMQSISFDSKNNKILVCYANSGNSGYGTAKVGTVSGTSISFGSAEVFQSSSTALTQFMPAYNVAAGKTVIGYAAYNGSAWLGTYVEATVSGTSVSFSTPVVFESASISHSPKAAAYDSTSKVVVFPYRDGGNSNYGTAIVYRSTYISTNLTATNFIGISDSAISSGAAGKATIKGGIKTGLSSLTPNAIYYVQGDGTITTASASPAVRIGKALLSTSINLEYNS